MNGRRHRFWLALALVVLPFGAAGCGGSDDGSGPGTELSFFIFNEPSGAYQEAAKACSSESDGRYTIRFEFLPAQADQQREQLVRRLGAEDDSMDILGLDVVWTAEFANAGWLQEWTGEDKRAVTKNVFESVRDSATFEKQLYAAPFTSNTQLLWYRKDRVKRAPKTWDEMLAQSEKIGDGGLIQVQASRYEGFTVWATAMLESAGATVLSGPTEVGLEQAPTEVALETMGRYASSASAPPDIDTSTEDTARLSFEAGGSSFMLNYPFVYPSAKENSPEVFKQLEAAKYPAVEKGRPSAPPLGGINLGVSSFSQNSDLAFEAVRCLVGPENQITAATLGGLPPSREDVYDSKDIRGAYPGFSGLVKKSIEDAVPRAQTPAYQDLSLAIQRALHPVGEIDPDDVGTVYEELRSSLEDAVKREGLL